MTNEERDLIARFVARVGGAPQTGGFLPGQGSVPQSGTPQAALPPIDREADSFINDQFQRYPEARYRITQMAVVQEAALAEMNNRLTRLQWELDQAHQQQNQAQPQQSRGIFGGLFGGGNTQQPQPQRGYAQGGNPWGNAGGQQQPGYGGPQYAPPPPQYSPGYRPGMFGGGGSGFLGSALTTAAGVAGGMVVGNALMNAFEGHHGVADAAAAPAGGFFGGGSADTAGNNAFDGGGFVPAADPTGGFGSTDTQGFNDSGFSQDSGGGGFDSGGGGFDSGGGFDNT